MGGAPLLLVGAMVLLAAIVAILALQAYLVLAPTGRRRTGPKPSGDGWPW
jgi:hypothetical protein